MTLEDPSAASGPETSPSLDPVLQDRAKALVSQLHKAYRRDQLSPPVTNAIGELSQTLIDTGDLTPSPPPPSPRQVRLEQLVNKVHTVLRQQSLDAAVQKELSKLLSLLSNLETASIPLDEFELAITALVQPPSGQASPNNLRFARSLRHRIAVKLKQDANPLKAIINASGSPHNRLISGLSWFFLIFAVVPSTLASAVLLTGVTQQNNLVRQQRTALTEQRIQLGEKKTQLSNLNNEKEAWERDEQRLTSDVGFLKDVVMEANRQLSEASSVDALINPESSGDNQSSALLDRQSRLLNDLINRLDDPADETDQNIQEELAELSTKVRSAARAQRRAIVDAQSVLILREENSSNNLAALSANGTPGDPPEQPEEEGSPLPGPVLLLTALIDNISRIDFSLILVGVVMGAMGSFVSVIVRTSEFIEADKSQDQDLFLIGFFRPIVGMTFALFLLALLESGVFLSDSIRGENERRIYLYTAIAFAAGFSERLVKDLITEHTERFVRK